MVNKNVVVIGFICFATIINYRLLFDKEDPVKATDAVCQKEFLLNISYKYDERELKARLFTSWSQFKNDEPVLLRTSRNFKSRTAIVIFYFDGSSSKNDLLDTITSLVSSTTLLEKFENAAVVLFEESFSDLVLLDTILNSFFYDLQIGFLQLYRVGAHDHSDFFQQAQFSTHNLLHANTLGHIASTNRRLERTYSIMRVLLRAGDMLQEHFEHLVLSDEFFETLLESPYKVVEKQLTKQTSSWSVIDFSSHVSGGILGKMIHSYEVFKFSFFYLLYLSENANERQLSQSDVLEAQFRYLRLTYQSAFIVARPMMLIGKSQLGGIRAVSRQEVLKLLYQGKEFSDDPMASLVSNMKARDKDHNVDMLYSTKGSCHFHAVSPGVFKWIVLVFDEEVMLDKVIVMSGLNATLSHPTATTSPTRHKSPSSTLHTNNHTNAGNLELLEALVEVSPKLLRIDRAKSDVRCADYQPLGVVQGVESRIGNLSMKLKRPTKCLKITLTKSSNTDLVIRQIGVFVL